MVSEFNRTNLPEVLDKDPFRVKWFDANSPEDVLLGENVSDDDALGNYCVQRLQALRVSDPQSAQYSVRWPLRGGTFNMRNCTSLQIVLNDLETILKHALKDSLKIEPKDYSVSPARSSWATISHAVAAILSCFCYPRLV